MIYLDTHIVVWLYAGEVDKLSRRAKALLNENDILISPIVRLELQYLAEINRITVHAPEILKDLSSTIGLKICDQDFDAVITRAMDMNWTRDPFDRIIAAHASAKNSFLVTRNQIILKNYSKALH